MTTTFNMDELFEIAEQIERNGAKFYRKAAEKASDNKAKQMLLNLAGMEDEHLERFGKMRKEYGGQKMEVAVDADNQVALYLQAVANSVGYEGRISPSKELTGQETIGEIVRIALGSEHESVVFYSGMQSFVSDRQTRDALKQIIEEELGHITVLLGV